MEELVTERDVCYVCFVPRSYVFVFFLAEHGFIRDVILNGIG